MHPLWKKTAALGFLAFLGLWIGGTIHGWSLPYPEPIALPLSSGPGDDYSPSSRLSQANNIKQIGLAETPLPLVLDKPDIERIQVHEKNAQLSAGTAAFEDDEVRVRAALDAYKAVIVNERASGIAPRRRLTLEIGVQPDRFEALVAELRGVGHLDSANVQQRDRTGEFRKLHAQRQALKSYLESVLKLRGATKSSTIDDALKLEQKIQDIEKELQTLGVQLGDLLGKESFYNVNLTLYEFQPGSRLDRTYTVPQRIFNGWLWAVPRWLALVLAASLLVGTYLSMQALWQKSPVS